MEAYGILPPSSAPTHVADPEAAMTSRRLLPCLLTLALLTTPAAAFERVGDKKILVFAGRQEVPTIDPQREVRLVDPDDAAGALRRAREVRRQPRRDRPLAGRAVGVVAGRQDVDLPPRRSNAKFHNGDPVTAEAVRWSFARTLKLNQGPAWMLSDFLKEDGIKVVNEHTIQLHAHAAVRRVPVVRAVVVRR